MKHRSHISGKGRVRGKWLDRLKTAVEARMGQLENQLKQEWSRMTLEALATNHASGRDTVKPKEQG